MIFRKKPLLTDRLRYRYRKFILLWIPVRVYVLHTPLKPEEIVKNLSDVVRPFRWYFLYAPNSSRPYSGKFEPDSFTAIRNNPSGFHRSIKIIGSFHLKENNIYVRLILSNPFSILNIFILFILYSLMLVFRFAPLQSIWLNILFYLSPILITYLATDFSFQRVYKEEKLFFFKLFKGRRLKDDEISKLGI
jgi:hypothetical protein